MIFYLIKKLFFYKDIYDLSDKINKYKKDEKDAKKIAKNGRKTYLKNFNSTIIADLFFLKLLTTKSKYRFIWEK
jgi:spore maturation protein CgeB